MAASNGELWTDILRACFDAAPGPLYPAAYAHERGVDRAALDRTLDELRLKGLVRLTEWVQGRGQGYTLTQAGLDLVEHPHGLRPGQPIPMVRPAEPEPEPYEEPPRTPLIRPGRPIVSWALIGLNIAIFLVSDPEISPVPDVAMRIFAYGALTSDTVLRYHQWWRLLSYAFLHGGLLHIFCNMYFFYSMGPLLEAMWGSVRMLILYLVAAVAGGCVVVWVHRVGPNGQSIATVGASGALCGLLGSLGVWVMLNRDYLPPYLAASLSRNVTINLVLIAILSIYIPNVSWEGHLGGAVGGALASFPLQRSRYGETAARRAVGTVGTLLVPLLFIGLVLTRM